MRSDGILKHLIITFGIAVILYFASFGWIQYRRTFRGPWELTFVTDAGGHPSILVSQPNLKISETLAFPGQKLAHPNLMQPEHFETAVKDLPFGEMIFQDPTFLPGTVTMRLFGHEVELLPRVLIVDKKEIPWRAGETVEVTSR